MSPNYSLSNSEDSSSSVRSGPTSTLSQAIMARLQESEVEEKQNYKPHPHDEPKDSGLGYACNGKGYIRMLD